MSTPNRLPQKYYYRRRVAAAVVILVVVALLVWAFSAFARHGADAPATDTAAASTTPAGPPSTTPDTHTPQPYDDADATDSTASEPTAEAKRTCELKDLTLTVRSDKATYAADEQPQFYLTVANPTAADCRINLDTDVLRVEVYDLKTNARVWSDVDCNQPIGTGEQTFHPDDERHFQATWSRTGSAPGQCEGRTAVAPGAYFAHAVLGQNASDPLTFNLG